MFHGGQGDAAVKELFGHGSNKAGRFPVQELYRCGFMISPTDRNTGITQAVRLLG